MKLFIMQFPQPPVTSHPFGPNGENFVGKDNAGFLLGLFFDPEDGGDMFL
jgi:hypothetical protein